MKNKKILSFLAGLLIISMVINSCKKDNSTSIQTLFTTGNWQLASVVVHHYLGGSEPGSPDTLNTSCDTTQIFTFPNNNTCTYTNYHCVTQPTATGTWTLTRDQLYLEVNITCKDTLSGGIATTTVHPFQYTKILSLGQYSMVLLTGDIGAYYTSTTKRTIYQYGFVRIKKPVN